MESSLKIPNHIYLALKLPESEKEFVLLRELAVVLYDRNMLSFGKARELAQMNKWDFHELLGKRHIERHYDLESFNEDLSYGMSESH